MIHSDDQPPPSLFKQWSRSEWYKHALVAQRGLSVRELNADSLLPFFLANKRKRVRSETNANIYARTSVTLHTFFANAFKFQQRMMCIGRKQRGKNKNETSFTRSCTVRLLHVTCWARVSVQDFCVSPLKSSMLSHVTKSPSSCDDAYPVDGLR